MGSTHTSAWTIADVPGARLEFAFSNPGGGTRVAASSMTDPEPSISRDRLTGESRLSSMARFTTPVGIRVHCGTNT
jgi:hypothetical protein